MNKKNYYTNVQCIGNQILYRGLRNGKRVKERVPYKPTLYVLSKAKKTQPSGFISLSGENVLPMEFDSIKEAREFRDKYRDVNGIEVHGMDRFEYAFISDFHCMDPVPWDIEDLVIGTIDIEVGSENGFPEPDLANEEVTAITYKAGPDFIVFGCGVYETKETNVRYIKCKNEIDLLKRFLDYWEANYPDIVTGWNCNFFDFPYLINRITKLLGEKEALRLSPWRKINERTAIIMGKENKAYELLGISILDYLHMYKKFAKDGTSRDNYKLNTIAHIELKEKKLSYSEYGNLHNLYRENYQLFIDYNIHDVRLVERLEERLKLIRQCVYVAYNARVNFNDVFTQVRMWDCIIYNHLRRKGTVIPPLHVSDKNEAYEGAFVKDPKPGKYHWLVSGDYDSLYPHLQMQYNLSPDTIVPPDQWDEEMMDIAARVSVDALLNEEIDLDCLKSRNVTVTPNGQFFRTDKQGFMAEILEIMYNDRSAFKKKMLEKKREKELAKTEAEKERLDKEIAAYDNIQNGLKVCLNSCYGASGSKYFRYFDIRIAEAVTYTGQLSIRWAMKYVNVYMNKIMKTTNVDYIIASDTDSMYIDMSGLIKEIFGKLRPDNPEKAVNFLDKFWDEKIQKVLNSATDKLAGYVNAYANKMRMKRESICDVAIWTAKKRYILNIWDKEKVRYNPPKPDVTGLEVIKSSTPAACRDYLEKALPILLNGTEDEIIAFVDEFRSKYNDVPLEDIAFPRGVNGIAQYTSPNRNEVYAKGTPIHVKGSLLYNKLIKENKLETKYPPIKDGEKIRFIYLKEPNPIHETVIAFPMILPEEIGLHKYIDHNTQFQKSFEEPLKIILEAIGWKLERESTLEAFFV